MELKFCQNQKGEKLRLLANFCSKNVRTLKVDLTYFEDDFVENFEFP